MAVILLGKSFGKFGMVSIRAIFRSSLLIAVCFSVFACTSSVPRPFGSSGGGGTKAHINNKTKFSEKVFGVAASPRLTNTKKVRKGGGRSVVGKPYKIRGKWYYPKEDKNYNKVGRASWYGPNFHGRLTANGEIYDQYHLSAAHPTFPLPSYARVTNLKNGNSVIVRVNDRGPYAHKRIIDLSSRAADLLDYKKEGTAKVRVQYIGRARMDGRDMRYLMASYRGKGKKNFSLGSSDGTTLLALSSTVPPGAVGAAANAISNSAGALATRFVLPEIGPDIAKRPSVLNRYKPYALNNSSGIYTSSFVESRFKMTSKKTIWSNHFLSATQ